MHIRSGLRSHSRVYRARAGGHVHEEQDDLWLGQPVVAPSDTRGSPKTTLQICCRVAREDPLPPTLVGAMSAMDLRNRTGRRRAIAATRRPPPATRWAKDADAGPIEAGATSDDFWRQISHGPAVVAVGRRPPTSWLEVGSMVKSTKNRM